MAKKAKRRTFRAARPQRRKEDAAHREQRLDAAATTLMSSLDDDQLTRELQLREIELAEADRLAQLDPSPANLSQYRTARAQYEAAERAVKLASRRSRPLED